MKTENISNCYPMESDQVYEGLKLDKGTFEVDVEGKYICINDEEGFYSIERLEEAEKFTMKAISTTKPAYNFVTNKLGEIKAIELELGNKIRKLKAIDPFVREDYHLGEYVTAFSNAWEMTGMDIMVTCNPTAIIRGKMAGEHINDFLSELRKNANDKDLKIKISHRKENADRMYNSGNVYIYKLFERYGDLVILRIDIHIKPEFVRELSNEKKKSILKTFKRKISSSKIFSGVVGYLIKTEYTWRRGRHWHCIFLLNGSLHQNDTYWADQIGKLWEECCDGMGWHYNCNRDKKRYKRYKRLGIGRIKHTDTEKRENLLHAFKYMCKAEQFVGVKLSPKERVFTKGLISPRNPYRPGRPRVQLNAENDSCMLSGSYDERTSYPATNSSNNEA